MLNNICIYIFKLKRWNVMITKPIIVCAAIKHNDHIITGARHFDMIMHAQLAVYNAFDNDEKKKWEQGFIDQWGQFYNREHAMRLVIASGQPFNAERNKGNGKDLYSEGLY